MTVSLFQNSVLTLLLEIFLNKILVWHLWTSKYKRCHCIIKWKNQHEICLVIKLGMKLL